MVTAFLPSLCSAVNTRRGLALENLAPRNVAPVLHSVRELEIRDPQGQSVTTAPQTAR